MLIGKKNDDYQFGSMKFKAAGKDNEEFATFGAGCYWGTEKWFAENYEHKNALLGYAVGFMTSNPEGMKNPTYN